MFEMTQYKHLAHEITWHFGSPWQQCHPLHQGTCLQTSEAPSHRMSTAAFCKAQWHGQKSYSPLTKTRGTDLQQAYRPTVRAHHGVLLPGSLAVHTLIFATVTHAVTQADAPVERQATMVSASTAFQAGHHEAGAAAA